MEKVEVIEMEVMGEVKVLEVEVLEEMELMEEEGSNGGGGRNGQKDEM